MSEVCLWWHQLEARLPSSSRAFLSYSAVPANRNRYLALRPGLAGTLEAVVSSTIQTVALWCVSDTSASQVVLKNLAANEGDAKDVCSTLGSGRSPGIGNGSPLQYSCLENSMDRGIWWATVHVITKSWTWLNDKHTKSWELCRCDYWAFYVILWERQAWCWVKLQCRVLEWVMENLEAVEQKILV